MHRYICQKSPLNPRHCEEQINNSDVAISFRLVQPNSLPCLVETLHCNVSTIKNQTPLVVPMRLFPNIQPFCVPVETPNLASLHDNRQITLLSNQISTNHWQIILFIFVGDRHACPLPNLMPEFDL